MLWGWNNLFVLGESGHICATIDLYVSGINKMEGCVSSQF